jgi:hypothetical protein
MNLKHLETITGYLAKLHGYAYFRPEEGPLAVRLRNEVLDAMEGEQAEELAEIPFDLEVSIGQQEGEGELAVTFSVDHPVITYSSQLNLQLFADDELLDLAGYLMPLAEKAATVEDESAGGTVVRRSPEENGHHLIDSASTRLKVTPEWLKSVIPCTDYSYEEIDGKKYIREYFWSRELIERLAKIRATKTTPEDVQYVAQECCEGDMDWAKDLIGRLKSPNRPEPAPREQSQKGAGRGQQIKGASQKQLQQKVGQPKGGQGNRHPQGKPQQQPQPGAVKAAAGGAAQEKGAAGNAPQQPAGERSRRSRHRRFRDRKDSGAKGDPAGGGEKQPQQ